MKRYGNLFLGLVFLSAGCSTIDVRTDYDVSADFSTYRTYGFADTPADSDSLLFSPFNQQRFREAIGSELEARDYTASDKPDLVAHVNLVTKERQKLFTNNNYRYWGPRNDYVMNYTEGTLIIDLTDAAKNQLVWQGVAIGIVDEEQRSTAKNIGKIVKDIFKQYPYTAGVGGESVAR